MNQQNIAASSNFTAKRVLSAFITPDQYDFWSAQLGSKKAWQRCMARVIAVKHESADTITLRLKPNRNFEGFVAGQHVNVSAVIGGKRITRCYSLSNTPQADGWVEITVRKDPQGLMSQWLFANATKGALLELENVFGDMTVDNKRNQPILMLAAGSGITPLMSLLRAQVQQGLSSPLTLVYWERDAASFCFRSELEQLCERNDTLKVHFVETRTDGRLSSAQFEAMHIDATQAQVLACGGSDFVEAAKRITGDHAASFVAEAFTPPQMAANDEAEKLVSVTLLKSGRTVEVSNKLNLLDALEEQGVALKSGCRMGICNTCSCPKLSGESRDIASNQPHQTTDKVRLCVTRASSNIALDA